MIIKHVKSWFNRNKKLYIIVNNKNGASKAKLARACTTIGMYNPNMLFSSVIVCKGGDEYTEARNYYRDIQGIQKSFFGNCEFSGEHLDAGYTQVEPGTSLAFGIVVHKDEKLDLKLW